MSDDDKTNIRIAAPKRQNSQGASIVLSYRSASGEVVSQTYNAKVQVGRQRGCDVCLAHELVSRKHADIYPDGNSWYVADLHSSNGTFLDGKRIAQAQLTEGAQLQFGLDGPIIEVQLSGQVAGNATHADTRTVFTPQVAKSSASNQTDSTQSGIHVKWNDLQGTHVEQTFHQSFQIGREASCAIHLVSPLVSRRHAEIILLEDTWQVRDLDSQNGVWVNGKPAKLIKLNAGDIVQFGQGGEQLSIEWIKPDQPATAMPNQAPQQSSQEIVQRYFGDLPDDQVGDHTMMVRKAFRQVQKKQSKRYQGIIAGVLVLLVVSVSIGAYQYLQLQKSKQVAIEMFYNMKTLALQIADVEKTVRASADRAEEIADQKNGARI